jgi:hypothetical protein
MVDLNVTLDTICSPSDNIVAREIEGDVIIIPITAGIGDADDELYTLNETGQAIWRQLDGMLTLGAVVEALAKEYGSLSDELSVDVLGFAGEMVRRGILVIRN